MAAASPLDTFGFTSREIGRGSAGTAWAEGGAAAYYNPGAVAAGGGVELKAGYFLAVHRLTVRDKEHDIERLQGLSVALSAPLPFAGVLRERVFLGAALFLPGGGLLSIDKLAEEEPAFTFFESRNHRLALLAALAGRIGNTVKIGAGISLLPVVRGSVDVDLAGKRNGNALGVEVDYDFAPVLGVLITPNAWLRAGITYRGAQGTDIDIPVAITVAEEIPPVHARVFEPAFRTPHQLAVGVAGEMGPCAGGLDATWANYADFKQAAPAVSLFDTGGELLEKTAPPASHFKNTWSPHAGVEVKWLPWLRTRAGYAYVPSPVPPQTGVTNMMDGDRNVASGGVGIAGFDAWGTVPQGLTLDIHFQWQWLDRTIVEKQKLLPGNPGFPNITADGHVISTGADLALRF